MQKSWAKLASPGRARPLDDALGTTAWRIRVVLATTLGFRREKLLLLPNEALLWLNARAQEYGLGKALMKVPMLHIYDNRDICLGRAQKLVRTTALQMEAGHHLPTKKEEVMDFRR